MLSVIVALSMSHGRAEVADILWDTSRRRIGVYYRGDSQYIVEFVPGTDQIVKQEPIGKIIWGYDRIIGNPEEPIFGMEQGMRGAGTFETSAIFLRDLTRPIRRIFNRIWDIGPYGVLARGLSGYGGKHSIVYLDNKGQEVWEKKNWGYPALWQGDMVLMGRSLLDRVTGKRLRYSVSDSRAEPDRLQRQFALFQLPFKGSLKMKKIDSILKQALGRDEVLRAARAQRALEDWPAIVGEAMAKRSAPDRYERGTVWVAVQGSAWAQELRMIRDRILIRLAETAGEKGLFTDIRFGVRPFTPIESRVTDGESPLAIPEKGDLHALSIREIAERRKRKRALGG